MATKRTRRRILSNDLVANPSEVAQFLAAFGRAPAAVKAPRCRKPVAAAKARRIRNPAEAKWLAQVWAEETENRRLRRAGLPEMVSDLKWSEI